MAVPALTARMTNSSRIILRVGCLKFLLGKTVLTTSLIARCELLHACMSNTKQVVKANIWQDIVVVPPLSSTIMLDIGSTELK